MLLYSAYFLHVLYQLYYSPHRTILSILKAINAFQIAVEIPRPHAPRRASYPGSCMPHEFRMQSTQPRQQHGRLQEIAGAAPYEAASSSSVAILSAAALGKWGLVHEMVEAGVDPNAADAADLADVYEDVHPWILETLNEHNYAYNGNSLLVIAAYTGT